MLVKGQAELELRKTEKAFSFLILQTPCDIGRKTLSIRLEEIHTAEKSRME